MFELNWIGSCFFSRTCGIFLCLVCFGLTCLFDLFVCFGLIWFDLCPCPFHVLFVGASLF